MRGRWVICAGLVTAAGAALCVLSWPAVVRLAALSGVRRQPERLEYFPLNGAPLRDGDRVVFGVLDDVNAPWDRTSVNVVRWHRPGGVRQYVVAEGGDILHVDIRGTADQRGIWLVTPAMGVVASLNRQTEEFLDSNRLPIDWRLPPGEQAEQALHRFAQKQYPRWATPKGGILLSEWPW